MKTISARRRAAAAVAVAAIAAASALAAAGAAAQTAQTAPTAQRSYAVVSEVARDVSFIQFQESTGTRLNPSLRNRVAIPDAALEKVALVAARAALKTVDPPAAVWLVAPTESDLFDNVPGEGGTLRLPDDLAAAARQRGSTHLLLLHRWRGDARIRLALGGHVGSGQLDGLGFYIDRMQPMQDLNTGQQTRGFIAPYLYMRATLVDLASGKVLRTKRVSEATSVANTRTDVASTQAYDAMTPAEKVKVLAGLLTSEIDKAVADVVAR